MEKFKEWASNHKALLGIGIGLLVFAVGWLFMRSRSSAASQAGTTIAPPSMNGGLPTGGGNASPGGDAGGGGGVPSDLQDYMNGLAQQVQQAQQQVSDLQGQLADTQQKDSASYQSLQQEYQAATSHLSDMSHQLTQAQNQAKTYQSKLSSTQAQLQASQAQNASLLDRARNFIRGGSKSKSTAPTHYASNQVGNAVHGLLRFNSRGNAVEALQRRLKALGYYHGAIDGIFGNQTLTAVRSFQRMSGIGVDGIVGSQTEGKLNSTHALYAPTRMSPAAQRKLAGMNARKMRDYYQHIR